jgi:putative chitinase
MTMTLDVRALQRKLDAAGYDPGAIDGGLGPHTYAALFSFMAARKLATAGDSLGKAAVKPLRDYQIAAAPLRLAHFLAQGSVETMGFTRFEENLNYTAERIHEVWPSRFPTVAAAAPYAHNPQALAEKVYGGRNGNSAPGDGWRYRGRGPGLTGKANYAAALTGHDLVANPDLAADPALTPLILAGYWGARGLNDFADRDDLLAVSRGINLGSPHATATPVGLDDRRRALARAKAVLL